MTAKTPEDDRTADDESPPVACTLSEAAYQERKPWLETEFLPLLEDLDQRESGVAMTFEGADETVETVARFVNEESDCCSFARYEIAIEPPYDRTTLAVSGPDGTAEVFHAELVGSIDELPATLEGMPEQFAAVHDPS